MLSFSTRDLNILIHYFKLHIWWFQQLCPKDLVLLMSYLNSILFFFASFYVSILFFSESRISFVGQLELNSFYAWKWTRLSFGQILSV